MNLKRIIREELEDLQWMSMGGEPARLLRGERVRVYNIGPEKAYEEWLSSYLAMYKEGRFGNNITGEIVGFSFHMQSSVDKMSFIIREDKTGEEIYFPGYERLEKVKEKSGLNLFYEKL